MLAEETYTEQPAIAKSKLSDYFLFVKIRLATSVVFSAAITYAFFAEDFNWFKMIMLIWGGFLVTGASNGFNQVIEKDLDKLMDRTKDRPVAAGRMTVSEGLIVASAFGLAGILILWIFMNPMSGILGALALVLYTLVYTPMKRVTPFAVFIGALPGAIPPLLGAVAATEGFGTITFGGLIMFAIQFMWQFPHFWAIAWVLDDDYKKAGFKMLPSDQGRSRNSAFQVLVYTFALFPTVLLPYAFKFTGSISAIIITILTVAFSIQAVKLYKSCEIADARKLMFGSFIYLPLVQLAYLLDKL
jgi:heme o synthase